MDDLPLKRRQFCSWGVIMQYAMAADDDCHQHLDNDGVGSTFVFCEQ
jgi:hypothetical protein